MIVKLEGKLERGFAPWKAMLEGASDKLKEHGMTVIYAGTSIADDNSCLLYTSPSPRDRSLSRMPSSA